MRINRISKPKEQITQSTVDLSLLEPVIKKYKSTRGNMIPLLQGAQNIYGYLPKEVFLKISEETGLQLSDMFGVASFYAQFRLKPVGKHIIKVCHGTACHVQNATAVSEALIDELNIADGETTEDGLFTLESVACLGCCSLAPVLMIGDDTYAKLDGKKSREVVRNIRSLEVRIKKSEI